MRKAGWREGFQRRCRAGGLGLVPLMRTPRTLVRGLNGLKEAALFRNGSSELPLSGRLMRPYGSDVLTRVLCRAVLSADSAPRLWSHWSFSVLFFSSWPQSLSGWGWG